MVDVITIISVAGASIFRNVAGWLENSLADGKINNYEWGQLGATILRAGVIGLGLALSFNLEPMAAIGATLVADFIVRALAKLRPEKKK